jgi:hypothetical protein
MSIMVSAPAKTASRHKKQNLVEGVDNLGALARVRQILEMIQENNRLAKRSTVRLNLVHLRPPCESEGFDRFSTSSHCHELLHPIALHYVPAIVDNEAMEHRMVIDSSWTGVRRVAYGSSGND